MFLERSMIALLYIIATIVSVFCIDGIESHNGGWNQIGNTIHGHNPSDYLGYTVDLSPDGTTMVVINDAKFLKVLKYNASTRQWEQKGSRIVAYVIGEFQMKVSADGSTIVVINDPRFSSPAMHVYKFISDDWVQIESIMNIEDEAEVDISGDGTTIAVTARDNKGMGVVRVYKLLSGPWRLVQLGTDIPTNAFDHYYVNIALSGNGTILAIGTPYVSKYGSVRVYKLQSSQPRWLQLGSDIHGETRLASVGYIVSLSSDGATLAITLYNYIVRVYRFSPSLNLWEKLGSDVVKYNNGLDAHYINDPRIDLSGDGTTIAVGDTYFSSNASSTYVGRVQIFKFYPSPPRWLQIGKDIVGKSKYEYVGRSVAVSADGTTVVVGSPGVDELRGEVRVFKYTPVVIPCNITWNLYNSQTDTLVGAISNGTIITRPPPCNYSNIQAVIRVCTVVENTVVMKLYSSDMKQLLHEGVESGPRYFLFGNNGTNINNGRLLPGTYNVQVNANGIQSPPTRFTINDNGSCS